jgi:hypothetical protein
MGRRGDAEMGDAGKITASPCLPSPRLPISRSPRLRVVLKGGKSEPTYAGPIEPSGWSLRRHPVLT